MASQRDRTGRTRPSPAVDVRDDTCARRGAEGREPVRRQWLAPGPEEVGDGQPPTPIDEHDASWVKRHERTEAAGPGDPPLAEPERLPGADPAATRTTRLAANNSTWAADLGPSAARHGASGRPLTAG